MTTNKLLLTRCDADGVPCLVQYWWSLKLSNGLTYCCARLFDGRMIRVYDAVANIPHNLPPDMHYSFILDRITMFMENEYAKQRRDRYVKD